VIDLTLEQMLSRTHFRHSGFAMMLQLMQSRTAPLIVETGCSRGLNFGFEGDGFSTIIFDKFVHTHGGELYAVDLNPQHVAFASSNVGPSSHIICSDSVKFLWHLKDTLQQQGKFIDLLYLDSFDFEKDNPHPSSMHHIKELLAIICCLKPGSILAVDDNFGTVEARSGKGKYVEEFMNNIGVPLIHDGYQLIWQMT
jgi:predicted O-methyltransferase YrrM